MDLTGKVALITGGASGIGRQTAEQMAGQGARIVIADMNAEGGEAACRAIQDDGGEALFVPLDVTDEAAWEACMATVKDRFGRLDVLVNAAGIELVKMLHETSLEDFRRVMAVNLDGVFLGTRFGVAAIADSGGGSIINISSIAGINGYARQTAYCASKGGVRLLTKAAAVEAAQNGLNVRVNSVHPGVIDTAMTRDLFGTPDDAERRESWDRLAQMAPLGRVGAATDVANVILFLASDASAFCTGAEFVVDGGVTAN